MLLKVEQTMDLRRAGLPRYNPSGPASSKKQNPFTPLDAHTGDVHVNQSQMGAILHLYNQQPSIQAARSVLVGQLLSSGISVKRAGKEVKLTATFEEHINQKWMPFARDVIDSVLMWGFVPVSMDSDDPEPFAGLRVGKRARDEDTYGSQDKTAAHASDVTVPPRRPGPRTARNLVPFVPTFGTYEIVMSKHGRGGYRRRATVFTNGAANAHQKDDFTEVFFRTAPDYNGSIVSPIAACFDYVSFTAAMKELALSAELVRATPTLVTQSTTNSSGSATSGIDPSSLFFDSESRAIQSSADAEESGERMKRLDIASKMANEINRMRTIIQDAHGGLGKAQSSHLPPEIPPRLFALPEKQQLVPNALQPQSRGDLEHLMRLANDHVAAALGVPASVLFEGRFSSNTASQVQLLNTTIAAIATFVNTVLSTCYRTIYNSEDDELCLVVNPISSVSEIQGLFSNGIIDYETAIPSAMHALGCTEREIAHALERRRKLEKKLEEERKAAAEAESAASAPAAPGAPAATNDNEKTPPPSTSGPESVNGD